MKLKIEITMENAAFAGQSGGEAACILKDLANTLADRDTFPLAESLGGLFDSNGNRVGFAEVSE